jgi:NtrC-family two-component system sensor histidine kinase KinB
MLKPGDMNKKKSLELAISVLSKSVISITETLPVDPYLQSLLDAIRQLYGFDAVNFSMVDQKSKFLNIVASSNKYNLSITGNKISLEQDITNQVINQGRELIITNAEQIGFPTFHLDRLPGMKTLSYIGVPISWQNQITAIIEAHNGDCREFEPETALILKSYGCLAISAIENNKITENLKTAQQRYLDIFESDIDAILIMDLSGRILETNQQAERIFETSGDTLVNGTVQELGFSTDALLGKDFSGLGIGETTSFETNLVTKKKKNVPVHIYARKSFIRDVPHIQWVLRDISDRKKTESLRNDLISMIYHDLRSPLANIVSSLDVLATLLPLENDQALKSLLNIAIRSSERIQRLTNSLLDMRRMEAGQAVTNLQPFSPLSLAREAVETIQSIAETKHQKISIKITDDIPDVFVDIEMIRRVLINLLENGIKYTPQDSVIIIGATKKGIFVEMFAQDNGPGIPAADLERIFEKFTRLSQDNIRGFGLGLAYCRLAVEANGGKIWVESNELEGACFKFILPIANLKSY